MKKHAWIMLFTLAASSGTALAEGGFKGPDATPALGVADALQLDDGRIVRLEGRIIEARGDERYTFEDASGSTVIEIDDELWQGVEVTPTDTVRIWAEVDREWGRTELEAERLEKVAP